MSFAIDKPRGRIYTRMKPIELYRMMRHYWRQNAVIRCYEFPMRIIWHNPDTGDVKYEVQGHWKLEFGEPS